MRGCAYKPSFVLERRGAVKGIQHLKSTALQLLWSVFQDSRQTCQRSIYLEKQPRDTSRTLRSVTKVETAWGLKDGPLVRGPALFQLDGSTSMHTAISSHSDSSTVTDDSFLRAVTSLDIHKASSNRTGATNSSSTSGGESKTSSMSSIARFMMHGVLDMRMFQKDRSETSLLHRKRPEVSIREQKGNDKDSNLDKTTSGTIEQCDNNGGLSRIHTFHSSDSYPSQCENKFLRRLSAPNQTSSSSSRRPSAEYGAKDEMTSPSYDLGTPTSIGKQSSKAASIERKVDPGTSKDSTTAAEGEHLKVSPDKFIRPSHLRSRSSNWLLRYKVSPQTTVLRTRRDFQGLNTKPQSSGTPHSLDAPLRKSKKSLRRWFWRSQVAHEATDTDYGTLAGKNAEQIAVSPREQVVCALETTTLLSPSKGVPNQSKHRRKHRMAEGETYEAKKKARHTISDSSDSNQRLQDFKIRPYSPTKRGDANGSRTEDSNIAKSLENPKVSSFYFDYHPPTAGSSPGVWDSDQILMPQIPPLTDSLRYNVVPLAPLSAPADADWFRVRFDRRSRQQTVIDKFEWDIPEHFAGSPLCPLHPKRPDGPKSMCPYHGRRRTISVEDSYTRRPTIALSEVG